MRFLAGELDGPGDQAFDVEIEIEVSQGARDVTLEGYAIVAMRQGVVSTVSLYAGVRSQHVRGPASGTGPGRDTERTRRPEDPSGRRPCPRRLDGDGWVAYLRLEDPPGPSPITTVGATPP
jgi:hypothetical protein